MHIRLCLVAVLVMLLTSGCSAPLDETVCARNDDCEDGHACNPEGVCEGAADLHIAVKPLMDAFIGEDYSDTVTASGGIFIDHYTWSLSLDDPAETRLDWIEIVPDTGEIRNTPGESPAELGSDLKIVVTVRDVSNRGAGQEANQVFSVNIKECRGDTNCWEYGEDQGTWGCRQGLEMCTDGVLSGLCVLSGWSTSTDHCGDGCGACDVQKADRCVEGSCVCGQTGGPCPTDETCCSGACTDLNDLSHCGACDTPCQPQNVASASCNQGTCTYDQCQAGYYDCDSNQANGCETISGLDNCNGCDDACTNQALYPNTTGHSCPAGVCVYQCTQGYADCDGGQDGCETTLGTLQNCSACGNACTGSADGGKICIDDAGAWRCGCASEADCDGDDMCCTQTCTPHDTDHCEDCDTACTIATGGPWCNPDGYLCQCTDDDQCRRFPISVAYCDFGDTHKCLCTATEMCPVDQACCLSAATNTCIDIGGDNTSHCGMCRVACEGDEVCLSGVCTCVNWPCPIPSGATDCQLGDVCGCNFYGGGPCPVGQYCCDEPGPDQPNGCCMADCFTTISGGNSCSSDCGAPKNWCQSGCCDSCDPDTNCD